MKKLFFLCGIAALAFGSCKNDETIETLTQAEPSIKYAPTVGAMTRAITTTSTLDQFVVNAYLTQDGNSAIPYIQNLNVNKVNGVWTPDQNHYWPHGGSLRFYSYSPAELDVTMPTTAEFETTTPTITYTASTDITRQKDVLYAVSNVEAGGAYNPEDGGNTVNVNFRHALAQVVFNARNTNPNWLLDIYDVMLVNVKAKGSYTLPSATTQPASSGEALAKGIWTYDDLIFSYPTQFNAAENIGAEDVQLTTAEKGSFLLLPQTTAAWDPKNDQYCQNHGAYFMIRCKIRQHTTGGVSLLWPSKSTDVAAYVAVPVSINWEEGKKYTYTFIFGDGAGFVPPTGTEGGEEVVPGTEILAPIRFTVDVDDFQTSTSTPVKM